jgi:ABC-type phosphate transport system substrate-binding protein
MKRRIMVLWLLFLAIPAAAWAGSVIVIANNDVPRSSLTLDEVQRIFLGKKTEWSAGERIIPVCLKKGKSHETFLRTYMDMNNSQFDIFWKQAIFTGKGQMPKMFTNEADIVQFVRNNPGGVGYIDSDTQHSMVKTVEMK